MADVPNPFEEPNEFSNVVLLVEGKKLHVQKEFLAAHSPVLSVMFNGDFAEKGKEEVEIKDVAFQEFVDLLNVIHPDWKPITAGTVSHILKLSDQFQMKSGLEQSENFLLMTSSIGLDSKLLFADQYNLQKLKIDSINSIRCLKRFHILSFSSDFANFSDAMKLSIQERIMMNLSCGACHCTTQCCRL